MVVNEPMPRRLPPSYIGSGTEEKREKTKYKVGRADKSTF
jgi:hypothetical protein